jgi:hypothetical protein
VRQAAAAAAEQDALEEKSVGSASMTNSRSFAPRRSLVRTRHRPSLELVFKICPAPPKSSSSPGGLAADPVRGYFFLFSRQTRAWSLKSSATSQRSTAWISPPTSAIAADRKRLAVTSLASIATRFSQKVTVSAVQLSRSMRR